jgi:phosphotransferase system HPr (HPr) family protein
MAGVAGEHKLRWSTLGYAGFKERRMVSRTVRVTNGYGIHCRPSCLISKAAAECDCKVTIRNSAGVEADALRVLDILGLALAQDDEATVVCDGENEVEAVERMAELLVRNFDFKR